MEIFKGTVLEQKFMTIEIEKVFLLQKFLWPQFWECISQRNCLPCTLSNVKKDKFYFSLPERVKGALMLQEIKYWENVERVL